MLEIDHLAVTVQSLDRGVAYVEQSLGVTLAPGGQHARMGTHNRLLRLGPKLFLEVIAPDPDAPAPDRARWFGLDTPPRQPQVSNWVLRTDDLSATLADLSLDLGCPLDLARGDYRWRITVPESGVLPYGGAAPAVLEWTSPAHPAEALPDAGCTLKCLIVSHPRADDLLAAFPALADVPRLRIEPGPAGIVARIDTPSGGWALT